MKITFKKQIEQFFHDQTSQRTAELVLNVVLILVIGICIAIPSVSGILQTRDNLKQAAALHNDLAQKRQNLEQAEALVQGAADKLELFADALPIEPKQFDLLNALRVVGENGGITFDTIEHTFSGEESEVHFTISGGGTYAEVTRYIETLEQLPRLIQLQQIVLSKANAENNDIGTTLTFTVRGLGYYYAEDVELLRSSGQ